MAMYCEICGEELNSEEESEGICESCKTSQKGHSHTQEDDYDPAIT